MEIEVTPLAKNSYQDLFKFEQDNWDYFAQIVGARPDSYRNYDSFVRTQNDILQQQAKGDIAFYLIYQQSKLVGRINLRDIRSAEANLGYRICQSAGGKGIATLAVDKIINIAPQLEIKRINAIVSETNPASEKVLLKNGFEYSQTENEAVSLNDTMINIKHFYKLLAT
ncbi:GNAT family N-acetyltransferase [Psychrobacter phenylpyruvicus]|uniref:Ribosomal-protein-serine acetyltransferase n=1 Tax=Psychrobacter phenylpyruvicus TaxID=29432 RepID=A0A379LPI1_9GAMM|nr:GNAT family N-acetyltransferase [Psychrobacter phenylpyruvicus]SUD92015.1 Ribosomal-protein-serine acetyltransferase [Psychrobacter phenylpyruvicus]